MPLPELIQALLDPQAYPRPPRGVELMQTQMSFVLVADDIVYKIKKPVDLGYLDYTTLAKRRFFCQQEVALNRRLCPEIYLDIVPISKAKGRFVIEGKGRALEYAVKMRRLPMDRMMNVLLPKNEVTSDMVAAVAATLAAFHQKAETNDAISAFGKLEAITTNTSENFDQTGGYIGNTITKAQHRRIKAYTEDFMRMNESLFDTRVAGGKIRDCHGDLHAAHICFTDGICIYDCIEFNDRFRYCDVASEVAFLAMDLDHYGQAGLSNDFIKAYIDKSRDTDLKRLLNFYKCYRAYVRGKVEGFKLNDPYITPADKMQTRQVAASYFDLAESYIR